ncbi:MAG: metallophosphoesterase family protein [Phycisphaerae bacterium]|nr:metallophosphoesterase family protein [Phycisphaerae bacterium]
MGKRPLVKWPIQPALLLALAASPAGAQESGGPIDKATVDARLAALRPLDGSAPAQWRLTWTRNPATNATVSWSTGGSGKTHRVYYDQVSRGGRLQDYRFRTDAQRSGRYTRESSRRSRQTGPAAGSAPYYHHARLMDLKPATTYHLVIVSDGITSPEFHFTTAPADDRPFSILFGGDSRSGHRDRCRVNLTIAEMAERDPNVIALCHGGDYVASGRSWPQWSMWLSHHELTVSKSGRMLPIVPARGNHDGGPLYDEIFDNPGGTDRNYWVTQLGGEVAVVTLNTNISTGGDQRVWLATALQALRPRNRWLLTQYHRPLYPAVKVGSAAKPHWAPLFEKHNLDVSLEADGHLIKRTLPIRNDRHDPTGVVYLGEGGLGVPQRPPRSQRWYLQPPGMADSGHHVMRLDFTPKALRYRTILLDGSIRDEHTFRPRPLSERTRSHPVVAAPKRGPLDAPEPPDPGGIFLVQANARWRYLAGTHPPASWTGPKFDDSAWPAGEAGFGYGDGDDRTVLAKMRGNYRAVYIRRTFKLDDPGAVDRLRLRIRYDDAFVAYLNGTEIARAGVRGRGAQAVIPRDHEARKRETFALSQGTRLLRRGDNVLAIEGHNVSRTSSDFTLDPHLTAEPSKP